MTAHLSHDVVRIGDVVHILTTSSVNRKWPGDYCSTATVIDVGDDGRLTLNLGEATGRRIVMHSAKGYVAHSSGINRTLGSPRFGKHEPVQTWHTLQEHRDNAAKFHTVSEGGEL